MNIRKNFEAIFLSAAALGMKSADPEATSRARGRMDVSQNATRFIDLGDPSCMA